MNDDLISREYLKRNWTGIDTPVGYRKVVDLEIIDNAPTVEFPEQITVKCDTEEDRQKLLSAFRNARVTGFVEFERPQGEWVKGREISRTMLGDEVLHIEYKDYTCSNCGLVLDNLLYNLDGSPFYKFCPNCGADMRVKDELNNELKTN